MSLGKEGETHSPPVLGCLRIYRCIGRHASSNYSRKVTGLSVVPFKISLTLDKLVGLLEGVIYR